MLYIIYNINNSKISFFYKYLKLEKSFKYNNIWNKAICLFFYYYNFVFNTQFFWQGS